MLLFRGDEVLFQYPRINAFVQYSVYLWDYLNILAVASAGLHPLSWTPRLATFGREVEHVKT